MSGTAVSAQASTPVISRNAVIAGGVVLFHVAALWALQTGLLRRAIEVVVPAEIISELIEAPKPKIEPPAPPPPQPVKQQVRKVAPAPAPMPVAIPDPAPAPNAPTGVIAAPPPPVSAPVAVAAQPPAPPAPPAVQLPSTDADYLQNPKPVYPPISKRMGEQGKVVVRVLIGADGNAQKAEIRQSSGFDRLDQAALATVQKW
ncbi:MAG: TonB family protein, partial [Pseudomonadota bacterium]